MKRLHIIPTVVLPLAGCTLEEMLVKKEVVNLTDL